MEDEDATGAPRCYVCGEKEGPYSLGGRPICRSCFEEVYYRNFNDADNSLLAREKDEGLAGEPAAEPQPAQVENGRQTI